MEPEKISRGAERSRKDEPISIAVMATVCGGVPASARGTPGIALHDHPAPRPWVNLRLLLKQFRQRFFDEVEAEAILKNVWYKGFSRLGLW